MRILLIFSLGNPVTAIRIDTVKILRQLNFKNIVLMGLRDDMPVALPKQVTVCKVPLSSVLNRSAGNQWTRMLTFGLEQTMMAMAILRLGRKIDCVIFSHCMMPLPMFVCRILNRSSVIYAGGPALPTHAESILLAKIISVLGSLCCEWAKGILAVSKGVVAMEPTINKYAGKTFVAPIRVLDREFLEKFSYSYPSSRENVVGFVGRLSWEKGIMEFVKAIPLIAAKKDNATFLIVGDGPLKSRVLDEIRSSGMENRVVTVPWTNRVEVYLRKIRLLVLPSRMEGIPSVILEAIACGTPVLVTSVTGLSDLLKDGKTAFLLSNISMAHLAQRVPEILERRDLDEISGSAYQSLRDCYSHNAVLDAWNQALSAILNNN